MVGVYEMKNTSSFKSKAQMGIGRLIGVALALAVGATVFAALIPDAVNELAGASLGADVDASTESLWGIVPLLVVVAVIMVFVKLVE